ncbi:MAG: hypothetical protein AAGG11_21005 [Pseudomonadota bacterium]
MVEFPGAPLTFTLADAVFVGAAEILAGVAVLVVEPETSIELVVVSVSADAEVESPDVVLDKLVAD